MWNRTWHRSHSEKKMDFFKKGMRKTYRAPAPSLHGKPLVVRHGLAVLDVPSEDPEVERPTMA